MAFQLVNVVGSHKNENFRGSITRPVHSRSTLRRADHSTTTQDSLPAAGRALPGGVDYPLGPSCKV